MHVARELRAVVLEDVPLASDEVGLPILGASLAATPAQTAGRPRPIFHNDDGFVWIPLGHDIHVRFEVVEGVEGSAILIEADNVGMLVVRISEMGMPACPSDGEEAAIDLADP